jgi:hypothetical protein
LRLSRLASRSAAVYPPIATTHARRIVVLPLFFVCERSLGEPYERAQ